MITELTVAAGLLSVGQVRDFDDLSETLACAANMLAAPSTIPEVIRAQEVVYHVCLEKWGAENGVTIDALLVLDHLKTAPSPSQPLTPHEIGAFVGTHEFGPEQLKWFRLGEAAHGIKGGA